MNEATRNVQVQATLANPAGKLHPGMFVQVEIVTGADHPVIALPASAINYAPYGDSVYVVTDLKDPSGKTYRGVRQQFVKIEGSRGDQVAVVSGVNPGDEVVSSASSSCATALPSRSTTRFSPETIRLPNRRTAK